MKEQSGFTLVELAIVIMVLGILAATVTPKIFDYRNSAAGSALKATAGAIQGAATMNLTTYTVSQGNQGAQVTAANGCSPTTVSNLTLEGLPSGYQINEVAACTGSGKMSTCTLHDTATGLDSDEFFVVCTN